MEKLTDEKIVLLLQSGNSSQQDKALNHLYGEYYGMIESMILENSGNKEQVKDVFQDGIIVLFNMIQKSEFELRSKLKTLLYSICKKKWLMVIRKEKRNTAFEEKHEFIQVEEDHFEKIVLNEKKNLIVELLNNLSEECKQTLLMFYYEKLKMNKIAEMMGLASEAVAKNKKSNCMKQLRKIVANNPIYLSALK